MMMSPNRPSVLLSSHHQRATRLRMTSHLLNVLNPMVYVFFINHFYHLFLSFILTKLILIFYSGGIARKVLARSILATRLACHATLVRLTSTIATSAWSVTTNHTNTVTCATMQLTSTAVGGAHAIVRTSFLFLYFSFNDILITKTFIQFIK